MALSHRRVARQRPQGQFRHDDQAASYRPVQPQRPASRRLLAEGGFDAADDVFEHHQGFLNVFNGPGTYDVDKLFENWGAPWEIEATSIGLKQFPCCGSTHPAIIMALKLRREDKVNAGGHRAASAFCRMAGACATPTRRIRKRRWKQSSASSTAVARALQRRRGSPQGFRGRGAFSIPRSAACSMSRRASRIPTWPTMPTANGARK